MYPTMQQLQVMTRQDVFDHVARHLILQGQKAIGPDGKCRYRADDDTACAVGALIPQALYCECMENHNVDALTDALLATPRLRELGQFLAHHRRMLWELQRLHDHEHPVTWPEWLRELAARLELSAGVVDETLRQDSAWVVGPAAAAGEFRMAGTATWSGLDLAMQFVPVWKFDPPDPELAVHAWIRAAPAVEANVLCPA